MDWEYVILGVVALGLVIKILKVSQAQDDRFAERINIIISEVLANSTSVSAQQILGYINHPEQSNLSTEVIQQLCNTLLKTTVTFRRRDGIFTYAVEVWLNLSKDDVKKVTTEGDLSRDELPDDVRKKFVLTQEDVLLIDWETPFTTREAE